MILQLYKLLVLQSSEELRGFIGGFQGRQRCSSWEVLLHRLLRSAPVPKSGGIPCGCEEYST